MFLLSLFELLGVANPLKVGLNRFGIDVSVVELGDWLTRQHRSEGALFLCVLLDYLGYIVYLYKD